MQKGAQICRGGGTLWKGKTMNQDKNFLEAEPVGKLLLKLALPTVAAQVINMLYNIVDRIP